MKVKLICGKATQTISVLFVSNMNLVTLAFQKMWRGLLSNDLHSSPPSFGMNLLIRQQDTLEHQQMTNFSKKLHYFWFNITSIYQRKHWNTINSRLIADRRRSRLMTSKTQILLLIRGTSRTEWGHWLLFHWKDGSEAISVQQTRNKSILSSVMTMKRVFRMKSIFGGTKAFYVWGLSWSLVTW